MTSNATSLERPKLMHKDTKLLVRPEREAGQSRQDYLMTLAEENGFRGIPHLCKLFDLSFDLLTFIEDETMMSLFRGHISGTFIRRKFQPLINQRRALTYRPSLYARVCPLCLAVGRPMLREFNYGLSIICQIHRIELIDRCPECNGLLLYSRPRRMTCQCRFDLRYAGYQTSDDWVDAFHRLFAPWRSKPSLCKESTILENTEYFASILLGFRLRSKSLKIGHIRSSDYTNLRKLSEEYEEAYIHFYLSKVREQVWEPLKKRDHQLNLPFCITIAD